jgi:peptidoglycan/xylan/chitin deacetylase (PgdA/CDA1 family)
MKLKHFFLVFSIGLAIFIFSIDAAIAQPNNNLSCKNHSTDRKIEVIDQPDIYDSEIIRGKISKKEVIFTFDGGSTVQSADSILNVLEKHKVKGTFFLTGKMIERYPDLVKKIAIAGHEIFSHTYDHKDLIKLSDEKITDELLKTENALEKITGSSTKPYFRAPYGGRNKRVLEIAGENGYQSVRWTIDALDWKEYLGETAEQVKNRILSHVESGNIFLMHISDNITGEILDEVFTIIESKGYKIVSLTQGL